MQRQSMIFAGILAGMLVGTGPCLAQSEPGGNGTNAAGPSQPSVGAIVIGEIERRILHDYYERNAQAWVKANPDYANGKKQKHKALPPGIAKRDTLPPGLAKQLERNGQLPPGLAYRDLPPDLIAQLPRLAPGYRYVIADDRVMLIRSATNLILDILKVPSL